MKTRLKGRIALAIKLLVNGSVPKASRGDIPPITPEDVAEARAFFPRDKFFIFGHARSGTTLLARLVRLHPEVHCNWQAHFFTRPPLLQSLVADPETGAWLARGSNRWNQGRDLSPLVLRVVSDFILEREASQAGKRIVGDKSPNSLMNGESVRLLRAIYPDARLIFIVRDGRDAALSHRFQTFIDKSQHLSGEDLRLREAFSRHAQPFLQGERSIFLEAGLRKAAASWVRNVIETDEAGKELFGDRYLSLRYEDLLANPLDQMSRIWAFLRADLSIEGLDEALAAEMQHNPDEDWQQQKSGAIARPLAKGKQGTWREMFTPHDREIFQAIAGETLVKWGYRLESR